MRTCIVLNRILEVEFRWWKLITSGIVIVKVYVAIPNVELDVLVRDINDELDCLYVR